MNTNCAPRTDDFFLFCYERDFLTSLSDDKQADIIDTIISMICSIPFRSSLFTKVPVSRIKCKMGFMQKYKLLSNYIYQSVETIFNL